MKNLYSGIRLRKTLVPIQGWNAASEADKEEEEQEEGLDLYNEAIEMEIRG